MKCFLSLTTSFAALIAVGVMPAVATDFSPSPRPLDSGNPLVSCDAISGCLTIADVAGPGRAAKRGDLGNVLFGLTAPVTVMKTLGGRAAVPAEADISGGNAGLVLADDATMLTTNTPPANFGSSPVAFGTVGVLSPKTLNLDAAIVSTDPDGHDSPPTSLSLLSFCISDAHVSALSSAGWSPRAPYEGKDLVVPITFKPAIGGPISADLAFFSDAAAARGTFAYSLSGLALAPTQ
jgi:hypothetical protein